MRFGFFPITLIFFYSFSFNAIAQVNQIRKSSDENADQKKEISGTSNQNADTSVDDVVNSCSQFLGCFRTGTDVFFYVLKVGEIIGTAFITHQEDLTDDKKNNPKILSAEFLPTIGYNFDRNLTFLPRMRLNWGMLATDLRYNHLYSINEGSYGTIDWQPLLINIFSRKEFYLRIGTGLSYETYQEVTFNEHTLSAEILLTEKLRTDFEVRVSHDGLTKIFPRTEASIGLAKQIGNSKHIQLDVFGGVLYQNYYQNIAIINAQVGIKMLVF